MDCSCNSQNTHVGSASWTPCREKVSTPLFVSSAALPGGRYIRVKFWTQYIWAFLLGVAMMEKRCCADLVSTSILSDLITSGQFWVQVGTLPRCIEITFRGGLRCIWPHSVSSVSTRVLDHAEGPPIQLTSSVKQEDKATTTLPVWALLRCQSQQQMFVNKLSVSNKPTTGLINHSNPRLPYKPCDFKSCWVRRN